MSPTTFCWYPEGMGRSARYFVSEEMGDKLRMDGHRLTAQTRLTHVVSDVVHPSSLHKQVESSGAHYGNSSIRTGAGKQGRKERALGLLLCHRMISIEFRNTIDWHDLRNQPMQPWNR